MERFLCAGEDICYTNAVKFNIKDCTLCVTEKRLFLVSSQVIIFELLHSDVQALKRQKFQTSNSTEFARLRIVDCNGQKYDIKFCGSHCKEELVKCFQVLRSLRNKAKANNVNCEVQNSNNVYQSAVQNVFSELVERGNILSEGEFMENLQENAKEKKKQVIFINEMEEKLDDFQVFDMLQKGKAEKLKTKNENTSFEEINDYSQHLLMEETIPTAFDIGDLHKEYNIKEEIPSKSVDASKVKKQIEIPAELKSSFRDFSDFMQSYKDSFSSIPPMNIINSDDGLQIFGDITANNLSFLDFESEYFDNTEIKHELDMLKTHKVEEQLLLYHFWVNYNDDRVQSKEKAKRLKIKISEFYHILQDEKQRISEQVYRFLSPIYDEIEFSIQKVLSVDP